jgi:microcystin-dependent protein
MDPYLGEIRLFPFNFAPVGWLLCSGQTMSIAQNTALFSLLGTQYGGDGRSTFGLPNFQGSIAISAGQGPGLSTYVQGQAGGSQTVTLNASQMPAHVHTLPVNASGVGVKTPTPSPSVYLGGGGRGATTDFYVSAADQQSSPVTMAPLAAAVVGGSQPHNNLAPYLVLGYYIATQGIFPPRP